MSTMRVWRNDAWYELDHKTASQRESGFMHYNDKIKLDNIEPFAEANQNAFSSISVISSEPNLLNTLKAGEPVYINADSSMDMVTLEGQSPIAITPYPTENKIVISISQDPLNRLVTDEQIELWTNAAVSNVVTPSEINGNIVVDNQEITVFTPTTYVHVQTTPSAEWMIVHNLNRNPSVTVVDSADDVVYGDVTYIGLNQVKIKFSAGFSGKAYLN